MVAMEDKAKREGFLRLLTAGGANVTSHVLTRPGVPPLTTLVLADPAFQKAEGRKLRQQNISCQAPEYISDFLLAGPTISPKKPR